MGRPNCNKCEILAPAGDFESVRAAVLNGATAVYLGQKSFSARQNAKNFDSDELRSAVSYCHARDVKVYQTLNTLIFDSQLKDVGRCIETACECGVDALIIQDMGAYALARAFCPDMPLHGSTQMSVHTVKGAEELKRLGFSRVVLARELSCEEIKKICRVDIETEVFVHGALCMSVSGQCYISSMLGGHSGNRGYCAGTCRMPFKGLDGNGFALSLKDMCLAERADMLKEIGVTSLKIEGRMKRPEYVAAAVMTYSAAINNETFDVNTLKAVFSRSGFTSGYFDGKIDGEMFGIRQKEDVTAATSGILRGLQNSYKKEAGRIPLDMHFRLKAGIAATLAAADCDGNRAEAVGEIPQEAINRPLDEESVRGSLLKLGGTYFAPNEISVEMDGGLTLAASQINAMRRAVCEDIAQKREKSEPVCFTEKKLEFENESFDGFSLRACFKKTAQIPFDRLSELEFFSLPTAEIQNNLDKLIQFKDKILIEPDRFTDDEEKLFLQLSELKKQGFARLIANNISHIAVGRELSFELHGGAFLNCTNSAAANEYAKLSLIDQTLSFEMKIKDIAALKSPIPSGLIIYGSLPLMLTRNCPLKRRCSECGGSFSITDRLNKKFRVYCNNKKSFEILNCNPLYMADRLNELPVSFGWLWFADETAKEASGIIDAYINKNQPSGEYTRGLYYRGIE